MECALSPWPPSPPPRSQAYPIPWKNIPTSSTEPIHAEFLVHRAHVTLAHYPAKEGTAPPFVQEPPFFLKKERLGTGRHFPPKGRPHTIARLLLGALLSTLVLIIFGIGYLLGYFFHFPSHEPPALEKGHRPKEISPNELLPKVLPEKKCPIYRPLPPCPCRSRRRPRCGRKSFRPCSTLQSS